jgi:hypothetical protein
MLGDYIMADTTHAQGVYMKQGAAELVVASGGDITVESGGDINAESGGSITVASGGDLTLAAGATFSVNGAAQKSVVGGIHTVTAGEASAGTLDIVTGLTTLSAFPVMVLDTGNNVITADADITNTTGTLTIADGSSFAVTENYLIHWLALGV